MKKAVIVIILLLGIGGAVVYFTGNTDKVRDVMDSAVSQSQGYTKAVDPKHADVQKAYETGLESMNKQGALVRNKLKQGEEATEAKKKLGKILKKFAAANEEMNKHGYLYEDQYKHNKKRIMELESAAE